LSLVKCQEANCFWNEHTLTERHRRAVRCQRTACPGRNHCDKSSNLVMKSDKNAWKTWGTRLPFCYGLLWRGWLLLVGWKPMRMGQTWWTWRRRTTQIWTSQGVYYDWWHGFSYVKLLLKRQCHRILECRIKWRKLWKRHLWYSFRCKKAQTFSPNSWLYRQSRPKMWIFSNFTLDANFQRF